MLRPVVVCTRNLYRNQTETPAHTIQRRNSSHFAGEIHRRGDYHFQSELIPATERIQSHPIHHFGHPITEKSHGFKPEYVIARTLQRNPNARVRENLNLLHSNMAKKFAGMSDEAIEWLLGGSRNTCRGGCANAQEFRAFLYTNPADIPSAQLISRLESIVSAIGFRVTANNAQEHPIKPTTPCQHEMYQVMLGITDEQLVRSINQVYTERIGDRIASEHRSDKDFDVIFCEQDDVLSDDEDDAYRGQPNSRIPAGQFKAISANHQPSWPYEAKQQNVYVRNHVSGTTPLSLAATVGLLKEPSVTDTILEKNEDAARELFTALLMPKFLRSDYHSLAETQAGIEHFIAEHKHRRDPANPPSTVIDPKTAERLAYDAMSTATCNEDRRYGVTPQEAINDFRLSIETDTTNYHLFSLEEAYALPAKNNMADLLGQREAVLQRARELTE